MEVGHNKLLNIVCYTDDANLKHRNCGAGLRVTDPSDLYRRETNRRVDRRHHDQETQRCLHSTEHEYQVSS